MTEPSEAEIDASYAVYDDRALEELDAWGDLASLRVAAAASRTAEEKASATTGGVLEWSEVPRPMR